jgi:predicted nucleic acid-binding protein
MLPILGSLAYQRDRNADGTLSSCAPQAVGCSILFSEDLQSGREFNGLRVVNPFTRS